MLFCLYINDVQNLFRGTEIRHILHADDLQIYTQVPYDEMTNGVTQLSLAADAVSQWAMASGLRLNPSKTQAIFFAPNGIVNRLIKKGPPGVTLGLGTVVPFAETALSLGVVLDRTLSWKPHIDHVINKANRALYSLRFFRSCTTQVLLTRLAQALVFPMTDYCSIVMLDATNEQKTRLQKFQNACVRYIYGIKWRDRITPYRTRLGWLRIDTR